MRRRGWILSGAMAMLAVALVTAGRLGTEFVPRLSEGAIVIGVMRPAGTDLDESRRLNTRMEQLLLAEFPKEIKYIWSRAGAPEVATDAGSIESTDIFITLKPRHGWTRAATQAELVEQMFAAVHDIPGQTIWFTQPIEQRINEMIAGVRSDVAVKLLGDDLHVLTERAAALESLLRSVPGCADLMVEQVFGQPVLQVRIDQDAVARYGVPASTVLELVESISGKPLGQIVEDTRRFPLVARLPEAYRRDAQAIEQMLISTPLGERIPLARLADVKMISGPRAISHQWGQRSLTFVADAQRLLDEQFSLPGANYKIEWGGQFDNLKQATRRLKYVVPVALALIVALLMITYRNLVDTALVLTSVPLACVGGVLALWLRDMPLSMPAAVGFITLAGVSVINNMVFSTHIHNFQAAGMDVATAACNTGMLRLRTVLMTALVACAGFAPMALSQGMGAEVQRPLATVVIGGVLTSTVIELLLMPVLYSLCGSQTIKPRDLTTPGLE
jgi:cobalt-zinc-cadmium resistance protein CzcA